MTASSRHTPLVVLFAAIPAFVAGVAVGRFALAPTGESQPFRSAVDSPRRDAGQTGSAESSATAPDSSTRTGGGPTAPLSRLRTFMDVNSRLQTKYQVSILSGEGLNDDFVTLFGLNEQEAQRLRDELAKVKSRLAEVEASRAVVTSLQDGMLKIAIPPFPDEGGRVYDEFMQSLHQILGDERFSYYAKNPASDVEKSPAFGMFGLNTTTMEIRSPDGAPNATSNWDLDVEKGSMTTDVLTNPIALKSQYPELYKRLVREGQIKPDAGG